MMRTTITSLLWAVCAYAFTSQCYAQWVPTQYTPMCVSMQNPQCLQRYPSGHTTLYALEGEHIALLVTHPEDYDEQKLREIVAIHDQIYTDFLRLTGRAPAQGNRSYYTDHGRALGIIAVLDPPGCGYACGNLGAHGIEIGTANFMQDIYLPYVHQQRIDSVLFYELGRNFWHYTNHLEGTTSTGGELGFVTGFAIYMQHLTRQRAGLTPVISQQIVYQNIRQMFTVYLNDPSLNWDNSFAAGVSPAIPFVDQYGNQQIWNNENKNAADFIASMLFHLSDELGQAFTENFFRQVVKYNYANERDINNSIATLFKAASDAVNRNLYHDFVRWKLPTPAGAQQYVPSPNQPTLWINNATIFADNLFVAWDGQRETGDMFNIDFGLYNIQQQTMHSYLHSTQGTEGGSGDLYTFVDPLGLCPQIGIGDFIFSAVAIAPATDPHNKVQLSGMNHAGIHCEDPFKLTHFSQSAHAFEFSWNARPGARYYQIHFARQQGSKPDDVVEFTYQLDTSLLDTQSGLALSIPNSVACKVFETGTHQLRSVHLAAIDDYASAPLAMTNLNPLHCENKNVFPQQNCRWVSSNNQPHTVFSCDQAGVVATRLYAPPSRFNSNAYCQISAKPGFAITQIGGAECDIASVTKE